MTAFANMTRKELKQTLRTLQDEYNEYKALDLKLNMARGKPESAQFDLSTPMLTNIQTPQDCISEDGTDCRNYGILDGLPEAKRLMAVMLDTEPDNVFVYGNSSLLAMYDTLSRIMRFGVGDGKPWSSYPHGIKWICPVPGYDRHFAICQEFNIDMIPVPLNENGPDMDKVEALVANDATIKGMWCVPKYSNPSGCTYSEEVVQRLAHMGCAADDFRIFWDNAYSVHHLYGPERQDYLPDIEKACNEAGHPNRYYKFASTSKVTFSGAGIAAIATSPRNLADELSHLSLQTIGFDKINQLRHARFLKDAEGIAEHMSKHAAILRPKFELVQEKLSSGLVDVTEASWSKPNGGYFVSFDAPSQTAKRIVALAKEAGVVLTSAGATWPYGKDPRDSNIRIAPTMPPIDELSMALDVFVCCVKIAYIEKLLGEHFNESEMLGFFSQFRSSYASKGCAGKLRAIRSAKCN